MNNTKTIYTILLFITLSNSFIITAQEKVYVSTTKNALTSSDIYNITINNVSIHAIDTTKGNIALLQNLFNDTLVIEKGYDEAVEHWITYKTDDICIRFYNGIKNDTEIKYDLAGIELKGTAILSVKGIQIQLGSDGGILAEFNYKAVNEYKIYTFGTDTYAYVDVNSHTNKVTKIGYNGNLL